MGENRIPYLAPGCFGSALLYEKKSMVCVACPFAEQCEPMHEMALANMREKFGIHHAPKQRRARAPTVNPANACVTTLPTKVQDLLQRLDKQSLDIVGKMKRGENPFLGLKKYRYMMVACHMIMNVKAPVDQRLLTAGLVRSMGWAQQTAEAHARIATQALLHVGAIERNDGIFSVRKDK